MAQDWTVGQKAVIEGEFRVKGVPTDPKIISLTTRAPGGELSIANYPSDMLTRREVGQYDGTVILDQPGNWHFRWDGSGDVDAVAEQSLYVYPSRVI